MAHHHLKLFTKYFQPVIDGNKRSEVRLNDRGYAIGDVVTSTKDSPLWTAMRTQEEPCLRK